MNRKTAVAFFLFTGIGIALAMSCRNQAGISAETPAGAPAAGMVPDRTASIPARAVKMRPQDDPMKPLLLVEGWEQPVPLPPPVNTPGGEDAPFITPDGSTLYFFFTPNVKVPAEKQLLDGVTGIWMSRKGEDGWGTPTRVLLQDQGHLALDGCPFVLNDRLYFCSARVGNHRDLDIWVASREDGAWRNWRQTPKPFNVDHRVGELHISADGRQVYFSSDRPGGRGKRDLWVSDLVDGELQEPRNLGAVNSPQDENQPFLSEDGKELWFTSDSRRIRGTPSVFRSVKTETGWSAPVEVVSHLCGEPTLDREGNLYFTHHYFKDGKHMEADIYLARKKKGRKPPAPAAP